MKEEKQTHLKFFGIGRLLPFLGHVKWLLLSMVLLGLVSSGVDIVLPLFQRYALDHFVVGKTLDTVVSFVIAYLVTLCTAAVVNYISCAQATIIEMKVNHRLRQTAFATAPPILPVPIKPNLYAIRVSSNIFILL